MPIITTKTKRKNSVVSRMAIESFYRTKYYSLFMNAYEFEGLDSQQQRFLLGQLWEVGTVCFSILEGSVPESIMIKDGKEEKENGTLLIYPYAPSTRNIYNFPVTVTPIRLRGAKFIPVHDLKVNDECVIGWGHVSHNPIRNIVDYYVDKIVEAEVTLRMNLNSHKMPRLIACAVEDREHFKDLFADIDNGIPRAYVDINDIKNINNILQGGDYIVDKLYAYILNLEKELLTILGIDNVGMVKKERENVDETNANNEEIDQGGDCFLDEMKIMCDLVSNVLHYPLRVKEKAPRVEIEDTYTAKDPSNKEEE